MRCPSFALIGAIFAIGAWSSATAQTPEKPASASPRKAPVLPTADQTRALLLTPPPNLPKLVWAETRSDANSRELHATFPSSFVSGEPLNDLVPVWLYLPNGHDFKPPFAAVVALHYLGAQNLSLERAQAHELNRLGVAALVLELPYHMDRAPEGTRSGELAIRPDAGALTATMVQSILDVRRAVDQLVLYPGIDATRLGISGVSLGALVAELAYGVDPRFRYAAFVLGGTGLGHILWTSSRIVVSRDSLRRKGYSEARLTDELAPIEPDGYLRSRLANGLDAPGSTFVVGARYDSVVPPGATRRLISDLNAPRTLFLDTGHYGGIFVQRRLVSEMAAFFGQTSAGETYTPPRSIHAPTLRLLAQATSRTGFDIGVAIDFFRTREAHEIFGSLALTPRGPEVFIGKSLIGGFAAGGFLGLRGPGVGLLWSAVL